MGPSQTPKCPAAAALPTGAFLGTCVLFIAARRPRGQPPATLMPLPRASEVPFPRVGSPGHLSLGSFLSPAACVDASWHRRSKPGAAPCRPRRASLGALPRCLESVLFHQVFRRRLHRSVSGISPNLVPCHLPASSFNGASPERSSLAALLGFLRTFPPRALSPTCLSTRTCYLFAFCLFHIERHPLHWALVRFC